jgi:hypothetical protein
MLPLLQSLGMPDWLIQCVAGKIAPPEFTFDVPCRLSYGFPPALLPVWSNSAGPEYLGVWHHWFGNRQTTFVRYHVETACITEIARTADQLRAGIVFDLLCNVPETDEVAAFAGAIGLCQPSELDSFFADYQDESELALHPLFAGNPPRRLATVPDDYRGDFAVGSVDLNRYCDLEIPGDVVAKATYAPPWFGAEDQAEVFRSRFDSGDLQGAWFCLNSGGWIASEMKAALKRLTTASGMSELGLLSAWIAQSVPDDSSY